MLLGESEMWTRKLVVFALAFMIGIPISSLKVFALTVEPDAESQSFRDWCRKADTLPIRTKNLVYKILQNSDTWDCDKADLALSRLEELKLKGEFNDLRPIASLKSVRRLHIQNSGGVVANLQALTSMTQLTQLTIIGNVEDIRPLVKLKNLTYLDLGSNKIRDLQPISQLTHLTDLELRGNNLSGDLGELSNLVKLRSLSVSGNITSLTFLTKMTQLESLRLPGSKLMDISPIASLKNLRVLWLQDNPIRDIQPLGCLSNLVELDLRGTQVGDRTILRKLPNLKTLRIDESLGTR
jgi:internalin A